MKRSRPNAGARMRGKSNRTRTLLLVFTIALEASARVAFARTPLTTFAASPPSTSEDDEDDLLNAEALRDLGVPEEEIAELLADGMARADTQARPEVRSAGSLGYFGAFDANEDEYDESFSSESLEKDEDDGQDQEVGRKYQDYDGDDEYLYDDDVDQYDDAYYDEYENYDSSGEGEEENETEFAKDEDSKDDDNNAVHAVPLSSTVMNIVRSKNKKSYQKQGPKKNPSSFRPSSGADIDESAVIDAKAESKFSTRDILSRLPHLSLPLVPALGSIVNKTMPSVPIVLSFGLINYVVNYVRNRSNKKNDKEAETSDSISGQYFSEDQDYENEEQEFEDYNLNDELNYRAPRSKFGTEDENIVEKEEEEAAEEEEEDSIYRNYSGTKNNYRDYGRDSVEQEQQLTDVEPRERKNGIIQALERMCGVLRRSDATTSSVATHRPRSPSVKRIVAFARRRGNDDMHALYERAETAENERDTIEREYESSSRQLQGMQQQLQVLSKSNGFLRAQLRDIQRSSEGAVLAERRKAEEEMTRVRESLVSVLERERRLMRAQMMKASERLKTMVDNDEYTADEADEEFER